MPPLKPGIGNTKKLDKSDPRIITKTKFSNAASLKQLTEDYHFFTYALFFVKGGFERDPVADYVAQYDPTHKPMIFRTPEPIFSGLECVIQNTVTPGFNFMLNCVHKDGWEPLKNFIAMISTVNRDAKTFWRALVQVIPVIDVLAMRKAAILTTKHRPMVEITSFGVDSTRGIWALQPSGISGTAKPAWYPSNPDTVKLGQAVLAEYDQPYLNVLEGWDAEYLKTQVVDTNNVPAVHLSDLPESHQRSIQRSIEKAKLELHGFDDE